MMDRRTFLSGITAGLLAAPLAAEGQQARRVARIGFLNNGAPPSSEELMKAIAASPFWRAMKELGWVEGQNMVLERRWGQSADQLSAKIWTGHWPTSPTCAAGFTSFSRHPQDQRGAVGLQSAITSPAGNRAIGTRSALGGPTRVTTMAGGMSVRGAWQGASSHEIERLSGPG